MGCPKCLKWIRSAQLAGHDAVCQPVKVRREYVWVPKDPTRKDKGMCEGAKTITVPAGVCQVYTLINEAEGTFFTDEGSPPTMDPNTIVPKHRVNALFEDRTHDWNQSGDKFRYASRFVGGDVWVLVEYHDPV